MDIKRKRGDSVSEGFVIKMYGPDGVLIDVATLSSLTLTVDSLENPPDDTTKLLQIVGSVVDAPASRIEFVGAFDTLPIGTSFFDVEVVLSGGQIYTPFNGRFIVSQDITKA